MFKRLFSGKFANEIIISVLVFLLASAMVLSFVPVSFQLSSESMPSIYLLAILSMVLIFFTSLMFVYLAKRMQCTKAWLVTGILYGSISIFINFFLVPIEYYAHTYRLNLLSADPNNSMTTIVNGIILMVVNILICELVYKYANGKYKEVRISLSCYGVLLAILIFLGYLTGLIYSFNPLFYLQSFSLVAILIIVLSGLILAVMNKYAKESIKISNNIWKGSLTSSFMFLLVLMSISYSCLWIIYMIILISVWKLDVIPAASIL